MLTSNRRFQTLAALSVAGLLLAVGLGSAVVATFRLKNALERQMAEDSRIISENLRIIFAQVTREIDEADLAVARVQSVLERLQVEG